MSESFEFLRKLAAEAQSPTVTLIMNTVSDTFAEMEQLVDMTDRRAVEIIFAIYMSMLSTLLYRRGEFFSREQLESVVSGMIQKERLLIDKITMNTDSILSGKGFPND
jgi:hypothetical protein